MNKNVVPLDRIEFHCNEKLFSLKSLIQVAMKDKIEVTLTTRMQESHFCFHLLAMMADIDLDKVKKGNLTKANLKKISKNSSLLAKSRI